MNFSFIFYKKHFQDSTGSRDQLTLPPLLGHVVSPTHLVFPQKHFACIFVGNKNWVFWILFLHHQHLENLSEMYLIVHMRDFSSKVWQDSSSTSIQSEKLFSLGAENWQRPEAKKNLCFCLSFVLVIYSCVSYENDSGWDCLLDILSFFCARKLDPERVQMRLWAIWLWESWLIS